MASVAHVVAVHQLVVGGEYRLGDVLVLYVVYLIPLAVSHGQSLHVGGVEERYDAQHLLVVFVLAQCLTVGIEKRHVLVGGERFAELVDVDGFVVGVHLAVVEGLLGDEVHDVVVVVDSHHRAVHPRLVLAHQGQVGVGVVYEQSQHPVLKNQVRLKEQRVVLHELVLGQREREDVVGLVVDVVAHVFYVQRAVVSVADVSDEVVGLVAHNDDHPRQVELRELPEHPVDEPLAVDGKHAFGVLFCVFAQALAHSGCQYNCLHSCWLNVDLANIQIFSQRDSTKGK